MLLKSGSEQANIWGADWLPSTQALRFESLINIRPRAGNRSMEIQDPKIRARMAQIVYPLQSRHYLEWMTPKNSSSVGSQLIELQNLLADWHQNWSVLWSDPNSRLEMANCAQMWSERLLNHSGLLVG